jgi:two-component system cell cycle response regulator DivK
MMERILVVEDNPVNLKLARVILQSAGYETEGAADATQAGAAIRHHAPHLILMDIGLPGKDGYAFTKELKSDPVTAPIPILVLTAYAMKTDRVRAFAAGCNGYLTKPLDRTLLLEQVRALLDDAERRPVVAPH